MAAYDALPDCSNASAQPFAWRLGSGAGGPLAELIRFLFYLAIALLIAWALYTLFRRLIRRRAYAKPEPSTPSVFAPRPATVPDLLSSAQEQAAQGNYRLALRSLYTALLVHLDRLGALDYQPTQTDEEHLRALQKRGMQALYAQLRPIAELVERRWYGLEATTAEDFQRASQIAQPILAQHEAP
ncbi:MAG TPA: DUF4129 domain-containing protein [Candidatus Fraserbacteria bacterium]|nr:DUF4129 domain-containing protein [Candidatus Fraserbacteria bacterium]